MSDQKEDCNICLESLKFYNCLDKYFHFLRHYNENTLKVFIRIIVYTYLHTLNSLVKCQILCFICAISYLYQCVVEFLNLIFDI